MITSFAYHMLDSIALPFYFLSVDQWHILDNIGSITCIQMVIIELMKMDDRFIHESLKVIAILSAVVFQEIHPWDLNNTIGPILIYLVALILRCIYLRKLTFMEHLNVRIMGKSFIFLFAAVFCFFKGLDDHKDPYRLFHGFWHINIGFFSFYFFQSSNHSSVTLGLIDFIKLDLHKLRHTNLIQDENKKEKKQ